MHETMNIFQKEWYERQQMGKDLNEMIAINEIPDIYKQKLALEEKIKFLEHNLKRVEGVAKLRTYPSPFLPPHAHGTLFPTQLGLAN